MHGMSAAAGRGTVKGIPLLGPLMIVYVVWGSTYLALTVAVEHLPPLTLSAVRFAVAGLILYAWCAWRRR